MKDNFQVNEILEAVNILLNSKVKKKITTELKTKEQNLPPDTEKIISEAEKYIKNK